MFKCILLGIFLVAANAYALNEEPKKKVCTETSPTISGIKDLTEVVNKVDIDSCPNRDNLNINILCNSIFSQEENLDPRPKYKYQKIILEASCVDLAKDSRATKKEKVKATWKIYQDKLTCNSSQFNVTNGSVIKVAVSRMFSSFILDVAQAWNVDLNKVDPSDQLTVLDYVENQIKTFKGTANEELLNEYYKILQEAGAKHKREL